MASGRTTALGLFVAIALGLTVTACSSSPSGPSSTAGTTTPSGTTMPGPSSGSRVSASSDKCPTDPLPHPPAWAASLDSPIPSSANLSGTWQPVATATAGSSQAVKPGPREWTGSCYNGYQLLAIEQTGTRVRATLLYRRATSGMEMVEWMTISEISEGEMRSGAVELVGTRIEERNSLQVQRSHRACRSVRFSLRFDEQSGHLIGTRNGQSVRYVPLAIKPRGRPCGPPPP